MDEDLSGLSPLRLYTLASARVKAVVEGAPSDADRDAAMRAVDACTAAVAAAGDAPSTSGLWGSAALLSSPRADHP